MADKNVLIQQKNDSRSYDKLYPFSPPVQYVNYTLSGSSWSSGTYSFESAYPNSKYNLSISVSSTATSAQFDAFTKAKIGSSSTSNTIKALGTVPTSTDIPIVLKVVSKVLVQKFLLKEEELIFNQEALVLHLPQRLHFHRNLVMMECLS